MWANMLLNLVTVEAFEFRPDLSGFFNVFCDGFSEFFWNVGRRLENSGGVVAYRVDRVDEYVGYSLHKQ